MFNAQNSDDLYLCPVCHDRYTLTAGRPCSSCLEQQMIDDAVPTPFEDWEFCSIYGGNGTHLLTKGSRLESIRQSGVYHDNFWIDHSPRKHWRPVTICANRGGHWVLVRKLATSGIGSTNDHR